jgi:hypothetical protein
LRFLLDTFIGQNDGVPFTIPGLPGLCSTRRRFDQPKEVPDYIQALEEEDLSAPGTVAHIQFRVSNAVEPPGQVLLGGYPDGPLRKLYPQAQGWFTFWDVPLVSIREMVDRPREQLLGMRRDPEPDSAVTLYWLVKRLAPGGRREVGFTYGLGQVASSESSRLLLTVGGRTVPDGEFTLTALRHSPQSGERLTVRLPGTELELLGPAEQEVPAITPGAARPISTVTWRLRAHRTGHFALVVESTRGFREKQTVRIHASPAGTPETTR